MEKWTLKPDATPADPERHLLLISGDKKDAQKIIKKFGKLCGRPSSIENEEGYNLSLPLHHPDSKILKHLEEFLNAMFPVVEEPVAPSQSVDEKESESVPFISVSEDVPSAPVENIPSSIAENAVNQDVSMNSPLSELPESPVPQREKSSHFPLPDQATFTTPAETLDPLRTFESLSIGSYNRFAHAAAISVSGAPGGMYNPLFLYGPPGSGKSHLAHSLAQDIGKSLGQKRVLLTSGWKLSLFASSSGSVRLNWIQEEFPHFNALIVDDIHLLALTEQSQSAIEKIISPFLQSGRQLIVTAVYPPQALASLAQRLKIPFSSGQAASFELKMPPANIQIDLLKDFLKAKNLEISDEGVNLFLEKIAVAPLENYRWTNRLMRLLSLGLSLGQNPKIEELILALFEMEKMEADKAAPEKADLEKARHFTLPKIKGEPVPIAWFFPKENAELVSWTQMRFFQTLADMGIARGYRNIEPQFYDPSQPLGLPFKIGEICRKLGPRAAVFLGPAPNTPLGEREMEWVHATAHVLSAMGIPSAWIPYQGLKSYGSFLRAHLDLII